MRKNILKRTLTTAMATAMALSMTTTAFAAEENEVVNESVESSTEASTEATGKGSAEDADLGLEESFAEIISNIISESIEGVKTDVQITVATSAEEIFKDNPDIVAWINDKADDDELYEGKYFQVSSYKAALLGQLPSEDEGGDPSKEVTMETAIYCSCNEEGIMASRRRAMEVEQKIRAERLQAYTDHCEEAPSTFFEFDAYTMVRNTRFWELDPLHDTSWLAPGFTLAQFEKAAQKIWCSEQSWVSPMEWININYPVRPADKAPATPVETPVTEPAAPVETPVTEPATESTSVAEQE